ncbi:hypothetical protein TWF970_002137 [Orbilia oligospora]|uniref:CCHC-type domain-containing protein n=1 Tax=Orbilia oligospora TaxID=2813651 RepID=A0A7C8VJ94_ORBOL|nr:hypothetical protein TWF970_002137 [Orbilia oligospora]
MASKSSSSQASKPVSSRLLNMKFMQKPLSSGSSPSSKTPPSKHHSQSDSSKPSSNKHNNKNVLRSAILAAQALESSRREAAINSSAFGATERWSLSLPPSERANELRGGGEMVGGVKVYMTGNTLWNTEHTNAQDRNSSNNDGDDGDDGEDEEEEETVPVAPVRRYFGGRTAPVLEKKSTEDTDSDDAPDSGDDDDDTSASESEVLRRVESKRAAKALKKEKDADRALRNLKQIGGRAKTTNGGAENIECFACGETGHRKSDCPNTGSKGGKSRPLRPGRGGGGGIKREYDSFGGPAIKKQRRY